MKNGRKNTIRIGTFAADKKGVMHGKIYGLGLGVTPVMFEPQTSKDGKFNGSIISKYFSMYLAISFYAPV